MREKETEKDEAEVVDKVCGIQDSACQVVKMLEKREVIEDICPHPPPNTA